MEKEIFIKRGNAIHQFKYGYSKVPEVFSVRDKVCIECSIHGEFWQRVDIHLSGKGCPKCGHIRTGKACRKVKDKIVLEDKFKDISIIKNPKVAEYQYIIGTIYIFVNTVNNKVYVGQTYRNYLSRWNEHILKESSCHYIHNAIKKYGIDMFNRYVIFQTEPLLDSELSRKSIIKILDDKERYYIQYFKSNQEKYGYNLTSGGRDYAEFSEKLSKYSKKHGKHIIQYDLEGNFIKEWESAKDIYTTTEFKRDGIANCCKGKTSQYKGYIWKYKEKEEQTVEPITAKKVILQYDFYGNFIQKYESSYDVYNKTGYSANSIRSCCRGQVKSSHGFIWVFQETDEIPLILPKEILIERGFGIRINQYSLDGKLIRQWINTSEIYKELNISTQRISKCLRGDSHTSNGYIWKKVPL